MIVEINDFYGNFIGNAEIIENDINGGTAVNYVNGDISHADTKWNNQAVIQLQLDKFNYEMNNENKEIVRDLINLKIQQAKYEKLCDIDMDDTYDLEDYYYAIKRLADKYHIKMKNIDSIDSTVYDYDEFLFDESTSICLQLSMKLYNMLGL